jgi:hypothetical protein
MNWRLTTVRRCDLSMALEAIRLGGGTVTATRLCGGDVAITYVTEERNLRQGCPATG